MKLPIAMITITLALVFYTWGVWLEHRQKRLNKQHVVLFLLGLIFDVTGTTIMSQIAKGGSAEKAGFSLHALTGAGAIIIMILHIIWAVYVLYRGTEKAKQNFHAFSLVVWGLWLIAYITGAIVGMR